MPATPRSPLCSAFALLLVASWPIAPRAGAEPTAAAKPESPAEPSAPIAEAPAPAKPSDMDALAAAVAAAAAESDAHRPETAPADAMEVFRCDFAEAEWDVNYDGWPDRWTRKEGVGYPHYVAMAITTDGVPNGGHALGIHLDGAQASVASPPIKVMPKFSYWLELWVRVRQAPRSNVFVRLDYLNPDGEVRQINRSEPVAATGEWQRVAIGPVRPRHQDIDRAVVRLETERTGYGDLNGEVAIANLWLGRLPSLDVTANDPFHIYTDPRDVVITCSLSGIRERDPKIRFQLLDATSRALGAQGEETLDGKPIAKAGLIREETRRASDIVDGLGNHSVGFEGSQDWKPHIENHGGYGFFQVRVEMLSSESGKLMNRRKITLAVIPPAVSRSRGEFGWTLPTADRPLGFDALEKILPLVGVNWIKLPIWFPAEEPQRGEKILQFAERMAASDIETIGVLQNPETLKPNDLTEKEMLDGYSIANLLGADPSRWTPLYDHIMTRLSLRIRWWQIGSDKDTSFVGYEDLKNQIATIRRHLYRFGQDVDVALGWRWDTPPMDGKLSWELHQMSSRPPLDSAGLDTHLAELRGEGQKLWVLVEPVVSDETLTSEAELHHARVREFVKQIVIAKRHGADAIFAPDPFAGSRGLMTPEGRPGELLLPWRTSAMLLGGAEYLGQLQLPGGSSNWLFRRGDGQVVMVLWNAVETEETLYLGDDIWVFDVWGKRFRPPTEGPRSRIAVGPAPRFVLGLSEPVARWRMSLQFAKPRVPSIFGQEHPNALRLRNGFKQGVGGTVSVFVPDRIAAAKGLPDAPSPEWKINLPTNEFSIGGSADFELPLEVRLDDAAIGAQPIRIDFSVAGNRAENRYRFSVWRNLHVGLGDVQVDMETKLGEDGRLQVYQHMTNTSGTPMSFKCFLRAKGRRRKRAQVFELGPELDEKIYTYSRGKELVGREIQLSVEEVDGPRVLVQRFVVEP